MKISTHSKQVLQPNIMYRQRRGKLLRAGAACPCEAQLPLPLFKIKNLLPAAEGVEVAIIYLAKL
jgi:hypothetical protein